MNFTPVDWNTWERAEVFRHFIRDLRCVMSLTVEVDISLTIGPAICPGKNAPEALARNPRRRCGTCTIRNFCKPRAQWPGGNLDRHSDFARRKFC